MDDAVKDELKRLAASFRETAAEKTYGESFWDGVSYGYTRAAEAIEDMING